MSRKKFCILSFYVLELRNIIIKLFRTYCRLNFVKLNMRDKFETVKVIFFERNQHRVYKTYHVTSSLSNSGKKLSSQNASCGV